MYITNIWGMIWCFIIPTAISIVLAYLEGYEEAKKRYLRRKHKRQYSKRK